jgi:hypothetical protein
MVRESGGLLAATCPMADCGVTFSHVLMIPRPTVDAALPYPSSIQFSIGTNGEALLLLASIFDHCILGTNVHPLSPCEGFDFVCHRQPPGARKLSRPDPTRVFSVIAS